MKLQIKRGTTSKRVGVSIQDSSSTTGAGLAGLTSGSAGLVWHYWREDQGDVAATSVTLVAGTRGTFSSGGFIAKDPTNMPGLYEIGIPDAALATGATWVIMVLRGATNMADLRIEIELTAYDPQDGARLGLSALPTSSPETAGGIITRGTGVGQLEVTSGKASAQVKGMDTDTLTASAVHVDAAGKVADSVWDEARAGHVGAGTFGQGVASVQGNVTGSVASVTGAVGSVTGAVGSVTGAVGSVSGAVGSVGAGGIAASTFAAGAVDAGALAADAATEIADALLKRDMSAITGEAARSPLNALRFLRNKWDVATGTLTVKKEDDSTTAWTAIVTADAAADPIIGSDPA